MKGDKVKPFYLLRNEDVSGTSGTGIVCMGAVLPSGRVVLEWIIANHATIEILNNLEEVTLLHGHEGRSVVIMGDYEYKPKKGKKK